MTPTSTSSAATLSGPGVLSPHSRGSARLEPTGTFGADLLASVVVFLVALPLCMGISIASGLPPAAGILTGIVGGLVTGALAGCPLQVSGPAAGLSVLIWQIVQSHGPDRVGGIVLMGGAMQFVAGLLRLGAWFRAVPPSVIHGMLAGIGVLIFSSQFHVMVDDKPGGSGLHNLMTIPLAIEKGLFLPVTDSSTHHVAALIGALTILIILTWNAFLQKRLPMVPGSLVAVVTATAFAQWMQFPLNRVQVPASLVASMRLPPDWSFVMDAKLIGVAAMLALIASAETLLSAGAVDRISKGSRTNYDKELWAQGVGNMVCGLIGALPMTGVIVRSKANVDAGGRTRLSAILHGVWMLAFVALLPWLLEKIPVASLAAMLVYTGAKLVDFGGMKHLARHSKAELALYFATLIGIVTTDLLRGIGIGMALAALKVLYAATHLEVEMEFEPAAKTAKLRLCGAATFIRLPQLAAKLDSLPPGTMVHVIAEGLQYIDHACLELFEEWDKRMEPLGGGLVIEWSALQGKSKRFGTST